MLRREDELHAARSTRPPQGAWVDAQADGAGAPTSAYRCCRRPRSLQTRLRFRVLLEPTVGVTLVSPSRGMMKTTSTLKLSRELKARIARVARESGRTPHAFMIEALERQTSREERMEEFIKEALAADRAIDAGDEVYAAADVHAWLARLASGAKVHRPKPWRA